MSNMFRCCNCGKFFDWPVEEREFRGEYWGAPCFETVYYSPCCMDDFYEVKGGQDNGEED